MASVAALSEKERFGSSEHSEIRYAVGNKTNLPLFFSDGLILKCQKNWMEIVFVGHYCSTEYSKRASDGVTGVTSG